MGGHFKVDEASANSPEAATFFGDDPNLTITLQAKPLCDLLESLVSGVRHEFREHHTRYECHNSVPLRSELVVGWRCVSST